MKTRAQQGPQGAVGRWLANFPCFGPEAPSNRPDSGETWKRRSKGGPPTLEPAPGLSRESQDGLIDYLGLRQLDRCASSSSTLQAAHAAALERRLSVGDGRSSASNSVPAAKPPSPGSPTKPPVSTAVGEVRVLTTPEQSQELPRHGQPSSDSSALTSGGQSSHVIGSPEQPELSSEASPSANEPDPRGQSGGGLEPLPLAATLPKRHSQPPSASASQISLTLSLPDSEFSTTGSGMGTSSSGQWVLMRRHTATIRMPSPSSSDDEGELGPASEMKRVRSLQRRLSGVYEGHHVDLQKLQSQMGNTEGEKSTPFNVFVSVSGHSSSEDSYNHPDGFVSMVQSLQATCYRSWRAECTPKKISAK